MLLWVSCLLVVMWWWWWTWWAWCDMRRRSFWGDERGDGAGNDFGGGADGVGDHSVGDNDASDDCDSGTGSGRRKLRSYTPVLWRLQYKYQQSRQKGITATRRKKLGTKTWEEVGRAEERWEELRWAEKSWDKLKRGAISWNQFTWPEKRGEDLRRAEKSCQHAVFGRNARTKASFSRLHMAVF